MLREHINFPALMFSHQTQKKMRRVCVILSHRVHIPAHNKLRRRYLNTETPDGSKLPKDDSLEQVSLAKTMASALRKEIEGLDERMRFQGKYEFLYVHSLAFGLALMSIIHINSDGFQIFLAFFYFLLNVFLLFPFICAFALKDC